MELFFNDAVCYNHDLFTKWRWRYLREFFREFILIYRQQIMIRPAGFSSYRLFARSIWQWNIYHSRVLFPFEAATYGKSEHEPTSKHCCRQEGAMARVARHGRILLRFTVILFGLKQFETSSPMFLKNPPEPGFTSRLIIRLSAAALSFKLPGAYGAAFDFLFPARGYLRSLRVDCARDIKVTCFILNNGVLSKNVRVEMVHLLTLVFCSRKTTGFTSSVWGIYLPMWTHACSTTTHTKLGGKKFTCQLPANATMLLLLPRNLRARLCGHKPRKSGTFWNLTYWRLRGHYSCRRNATQTHTPRSRTCSNFSVWHCACLLVEAVMVPEGPFATKQFDKLSSCFLDALPDPGTSSSGTSLGTFHGTALVLAISSGCPLSQRSNLYSHEWCPKSRRDWPEQAT